MQPPGGSGRHKAAKRAIWACARLTYRPINNTLELCEPHPFQRTSGVSASSRRALASIALLTGLAAAVVSAQAPAGGLSVIQQEELKIWSEQLADRETSPRTKRQAANLLVRRSYPEATKVLLDFLAGKNHQQAKIAIADSLAAGGDPTRKEFIEPLMDMFVGGEPEVRAAAGRALMVYRDDGDGVIERLIEVMRDPAQDRAVRLETMSVLQNVLDKRVVGALVASLEAEDPAVREAALDTLPKLTKIYGYSRPQWRRWWETNQRKPLSEMLKDWAENIAKRSQELEQQNAELRARLAEATQALYEATPPEGRDALLAAYLGDAVPDVRAAGLRLLAASLPARDGVPEELRDQARDALDDDSALVRAEAASLAGKLADAGSVEPILARLEAEPDPQVREALLRALAHLRAPRAVPALLKDVGSDRAQVAAAAAVALEKTVAEHGLAEGLREQAVEILLARHKAMASRSASAPLREALLRAMGAVGSPTFVPVLRASLTDEVATVRLAAVHALGELGDADAADAVLPLMNDPDRGIRRAAIVAVALLSGPEHLAEIMDRTLPATEADPGVRKQAEDEAARIIEEAPPAALTRLVESLDGRADLVDWRIRVLASLVGKKAKNGDADLPAVRRALADALLAAGRHGEAADQFQRVYEQLRAEKSDEAPEAWLAWLSALSVSDPASAVTRLAEQEDDEAFAQAYRALIERLTGFQEAGRWETVAAVTATCIDTLAPRLTVEQMASLQQMLTEAKKRLTEADTATQPAAIGQGAGPLNRVC